MVHLRQQEEIEGYFRDCVRTGKFFELFPGPDTDGAQFLWKWVAVGGGIVTAMVAIRLGRAG